MGQPFLKSAVAVLEGSDRPLTAREIVEQAVADGSLDGTSIDASSSTMRGVLTNNIRQKGADSHFVMQDDKFVIRGHGAASGGAKNAGALGTAQEGTGMRPAAKRRKRPSQQQLSGVGGEHLVVGHLNSEGYSTVMPDPDEGVDIVATKDGCNYPLQVKTSKGRGGRYTFKFKKSSHEKLQGPHAHYVFVLRKEEDNIFVVVPYTEIQKQINLENIPLKKSQYEVKIRLNTVSLGSQRADMTQYERRWPNTG